MEITQTPNILNSSNYSEYSYKYIILYVCTRPYELLVYYTINPNLKGDIDILKQNSTEQRKGFLIEKVSKYGDNTNSIYPELTKLFRILIKVHYPVCLYQTSHIIIYVYNKLHENPLKYISYHRRACYIQGCIYHILQQYYLSTYNIYEQKHMYPPVQLVL